MKLQTLIKSLTLWSAFVLAGVLLVGCSRTVTWEEEVPLNVGETILVKREVIYKVKGGGGNPLDLAYRPDWTEEISFKWNGKNYWYVGDAGLMVLAISPMTKHPVLVAEAALKNWDSKHGYRCTIPYYVQFVPQADGKEWSWQSNIEPWLFNLPRNLMAEREAIDKMKSRYTSSDRTAMDMTMSIKSPYLARIEPTHRFDDCRK